MNVALLAVAVAALLTAAVARRLNWSAPLLLVPVGLAGSQIPGLPDTAFDPDLDRIVERCGDPLIVPDALEGDATDIAFAASAVETDGMIALYYSLSDQALQANSLDTHRKIDELVL